MKNHPYFVLKCSLLALMATVSYNFYNYQYSSEPVSSSIPIGNMAFKPFVVLELFTSQGCSSCPPADDILRGVADKENVFALSFHVTYWNKLGWKDEFSQNMFDERQYTYGRLTRSEGVYTPQLVINGTDAFVGSRKSQTDKSIENALLQKPEAGILMNKIIEGNRLKINYQLIGKVENTLLNIAFVERNLETQVLRGENGGRLLKNDNVVRVFKTIPILNKSSHEGTVSFDYKQHALSKNCSIIAYLQNNTTWKITAANRVDVGL